MLIIVTFHRLQSKHTVNACVDARYLTPGSDPASDLRARTLLRLQGPVQALKAVNNENFISENRFMQVLMRRSCPQF
jgi:hypothetical protein